uniref:SEA domain-containing protein n=1 Tax=Syphacia muris TaxID=451379 RepID=A0A0N5A9M3_9BILA
MFFLYPVARITGAQPLYQNINSCCLSPEAWRVVNSTESPFVIAQQQILPIGHSAQAVIKEKNSELPSKASLFLWIIVLLLLASTIVILPILAISKSNNNYDTWKRYYHTSILYPHLFLVHSVSSSSLKLAHKYDGRMIITEGSLLHFDGLVLQTNTEEFAAHAQKFVRALPYRLLPKVPAMEVLFTVKFGHGLDLDPYDITLMLRKYISTHGFDGNSVDENSISIAEKQ